MLRIVVPVILVVTYALQSTVRYWRAPNPYRFSIWLVGILMAVGVLILLDVPLLAQVLPSSFTPVVRLATHQLFNVCLMLAGYFVNVYCTDIMDGWSSGQARQQQQRFLAYLLGTLTLMTIFFVRALQDGERETPTWFAADPSRNGNLIIVSIACLMYMVVIYLRIATFSMQFARITPVPSFKTGNYCFLLVCLFGLADSLIAFVGLFVPASSPIAVYLQLGSSLLISMLMSVFYLGTRLVDNPGRRLRRFGERAWSIMTVIRLYPLWHVLTTTIPDVVPPLTMPWIAVVFQNRVALLRDARIIEILDAMHRLEISLWDETSHREWLTNIQQVINNPHHVGETPHQHVHEVESIAQKDAARLIIALANYVPSSHALPQQLRIVAPIATIAHAPSFSAQEVHYLELVASAFRRMHYAVTQQPDLVTSRFDIV